MTAGNASGINDGAAALVVASPARAAGPGLRPIARVLSYAVVGVEPMVMGLGPIGAVRLALDRAALGAARTSICSSSTRRLPPRRWPSSRELGLDVAKVNVRGGAIALGHPIGASGARMLTTLIYALRARGGGRGVASLCIGGGMGIAVVIEACRLVGHRLRRPELHPRAASVPEAMVKLLAGLILLLVAHPRLRSRLTGRWTPTSGTGTAPASSCLRDYHLAAGETARGPIIVLGGTATIDGHAE